jgi:acyl carrier protein
MTTGLVAWRSPVSVEEDTMTAADVKKRIVEIIATQLGIDQADVTPEASVVDDLGADSLDVVELIMALEEEFNLEIPDEEAEKIKNVQDIFTYLESALKAA